MTVYFSEDGRISRSRKNAYLRTAKHRIEILRPCNGACLENMDAFGPFGFGYMDLYTYEDGKCNGKCNFKSDEYYRKVLSRYSKKLMEMNKNFTAEQKNIKKMLKLSKTKTKDSK